MLTEIDVDFREYWGLGACNPKLAHQALTLEDKIDSMLPCNVMVRGSGGGKTEIAAIDPVASTQAVENPKPKPPAAEVRTKLTAAIARL